MRKCSGTVRKMTRLDVCHCQSFPHYSQTHSLHPVVFSNLKNFSESQIHSCQSCWFGFPFLFVQSIQGKMALRVAWSHLFLKTKKNKRWKGMEISGCGEDAHMGYSLQVNSSCVLFGIIGFLWQIILEILRLKIFEKQTKILVSIIFTILYTHCSRHRTTQEVTSP